MWEVGIIMFILQKMKPRLGNSKQLLRVTKLENDTNLTFSKPHSQTGQKRGSKNELGRRSKS